MSYIGRSARSESREEAAAALMEMAMGKLPSQASNWSSSRHSTSTGNGIRPKTKSTATGTTASHCGSRLERVEAEMKKAELLAQQQIHEARIEAAVAIKEAQINAQMRCKLVDFVCDLKTAENQSLMEERRSSLGLLNTRLREFDDEDLGLLIPQNAAAYGRDTARQEPVHSVLSHHQEPVKMQQYEYPGVNQGQNGGSQNHHRAQPQESRAFDTSQPVTTLNNEYPGVNQGQNGGSQNHHRAQPQESRAFDTSQPVTTLNNEYPGVNQGQNGGSQNHHRAQPQESSRQTSGLLLNVMNTNGGSQDHLRTQHTESRAFETSQPVKTSQYEYPGVNQGQNGGSQNHHRAQQQESRSRQASGLPLNVTNIDGGSQDYHRTQPQEFRAFDTSQPVKTLYNDYPGVNQGQNGGSQDHHRPQHTESRAFETSRPVDTSQYDDYPGDNQGQNGGSQDHHRAHHQESRSRQTLPVNMVNGMNTNGGSQLNIESEVVQHLRTLQNRLELPKPDMKGFSGDPLDFARFKMAFKTNIESRTENKAELFQNLRKYCTGPASDAIKKFDMLPPETAFKEATQELWRSYGQSHIITHEFHQKLQKTADMRPGDRQDLKRYADLLETVEISLRSLGKQSALDHSGYLVEIVGKLAAGDKRAWLRKTAKIRETCQDVTFKDVVEFVKNLASQVNDSEFAILLDSKRKGYDNKGYDNKGYDNKHGDKKNVAGKSGPSTCFVSEKMENSTSSTKTGNTANKKGWTPRNKEMSSSTVNRETPVSTGNVPDTSEKNKKCLCHGAPHLLWKCSEFKTKPYKERFEVIKNKNLCYNCLNIDSRLPHTIASKCPLPKECSIRGCKAVRKHNTLLHYDDQQKSDQECHCTESDSSVYFPAFPVTIRSPVTGKEVQAWAGIDTYSSACFCDKDLLQELSIESNEQNMTVNTLKGSVTGSSTVIELIITGLEDEDSRTELKEVYSWDKLPIGEKHIPKRSVWSQYNHLKDIPISATSTDKLRILVGSNVPEAHRQLEWRPGPERADPVAVKYIWGWTLLGGIPHGKLSCNFTTVEHNYEDLNQKLIQLAEFEYVGTKHESKKPFSADDVTAKEILEQGTYFCDGHYYVPIPLKDSHTSMPNNREVAVKRLMSVKKKLAAGRLLIEDKTEYKAYCDIFDDYHKKGYTRRIPADEIQTDDIVNYIPFHHVIHPAKPGKLRVVWDAAARYKGSCLNDHIYSGEDSVNSLLGVLLRFRTGGEIAIQADINAMFNQVLVPRENWNLMRFLWFEDNDLDGEIVEFQLTHNFFGGTHAPGNAAYALKRTCKDNTDNYHPETIKTGLRNTYVDDILRSASPETAKIIIQQIFKLLDEGGFVLAKCVVNDRELLELVDVDRRAKTMQEFEFDKASGQEQQERVLGVSWNVGEDSLVFRSRKNERPITRRGLLGYIASLFDPEGAIAPVMLQPKQILQKLTIGGVGWDDPLPAEDVAAIKKWLESLDQLTCLSRPRYTAQKGQKIVCQELHAFSDGSETGYGYVLFARYILENGDVHVSFLVGKSLVTPKKKKTIPRIELQAALLSMRALKFVVQEADVKWDAIYQWIDSTAVLAMLNNRSRRFLPYCANRLQEIRETQQEMAVQIRHVPGLQNIADICSRGLPVNKFVKCWEYYNGPGFLREPPGDWPVCPAIESLAADHPELKKEATVMAIVEDEDSLMELVERFSGWTRLKRAGAWILRFKVWALQTKCGKRKDLYTGPTGAIKASEMHDAEIALVTYVQGKVFHKEITQFGKIGPKMRRCQLHNLRPFVDKTGSVRVGGRLTESKDLTFEEKHQLILPKKHHLTTIIAREYHEENQHAPPQTLLCLLRQRYWVLHGSSVVHKIEGDCNICKRAIGQPKDQLQGVLPEGRVASGNLWFQCGCDIMGPVLIKINRSQVKRYVLGLVSFTTKAVHFEIMPDLTVISFLNAMRRFVARRSRPKKLITDNAGTFSAGVKEINALQELYNSSGVQHFMQQKEIEWVPNVPKASNRNGLFERPFRTLRRVMLHTIKGQVTTEDQLATVVAECEFLYNSRPLCSTSDSPRDPKAITPMMIINPEPATAHPPGVFFEKDLIIRNRYRQVQALVNAFWARFRVEYLTSLQERQKSITQIRNFQVSDLVMMVDEMKISHRGHYPLALITAVHPSEADGEVRKVTLKTATGEFQRPVNKIVLLEASEEREDLHDTLTN